jgi:protoporphyrin/coproporphyrin ferrochelatase
LSGSAEAAVGVLVMAHGTPARLEDLPGFYTEIRRGRPPSAEQLAELEARYRAIGGTSPLNATTRAQAAGIAAALERDHPGRFVVRHGARFAHPRVEEAVAQLAESGATRLVGVVMAPHSSRASVAEYERRARQAAAEAPATAEGGLALSMVDHYYDAPGFAELVAARVGLALETLPEQGRAQPVVVFTAHSVPAALLAAGDTYADQVAASAAAVAEAAGLGRWQVAYQSAGRTDDEWLGPDLNDVIAGAAGAGTTAVVVCPIGFVADHLEVLYDVDIEARAVAEKADLAFARTASFNDDPDFCALVAGVVARMAGTATAATGAG